MQFTRNNYRADRLNGQIAEVVAINPVGSSMVVEHEDGRRDMLDLAHLADRHVQVANYCNAVNNSSTSDLD